MTKTKKQLRAEAVERLKEPRYENLSDYVYAMLGWGHEPRRAKEAKAALIDLLTDDDEANPDASAFIGYTLKGDTFTGNMGEEASSTCAANRPISKSADRETPETAEIGALKDEIRDFDDSREKLEAEVRQYVLDAWAQGWEAGQHDDMDCRNFYIDEIRVLLDRQAAITEREWLEGKTHIFGMTFEEVRGLKAKIEELTADLNTAVCDNNSLRYELESIEEHKAKVWCDCDCCKWQEEREELTAEHERIVQEMVDANTRQCERTNELIAERDYWKDQLLSCVNKAEFGDYAEGVMQYPRPYDCCEPSLLVTDTIDSLRDFYGETRRRNDELTAERDELQRQLDTMRDVTREFRDERDHYRDKFGKALDLAHEIARLGN